MGTSYAMIPLTATAAMAAPDDEANASVVIRGTAAAFHGAMSSHTRLMHMLAAPTRYQSRRVKEESTIGAQANSSVNARFEAAIITAVCWTATPALTRLLANASPMTPTGHAVQTCRKKNAPGGHFRSCLTALFVGHPIQVRQIKLFDLQHTLEKGCVAPRFASVSSRASGAGTHAKVFVTQPSSFAGHDDQSN